MTTAQKWTLAILAIAVLAVAAVVALSLTEDTAALDGNSIEGEIQRGLERRTGELATVNCPEEIPIEKGKISDCTAIDSLGERYNVRVTQDDDEGHFTWQLSP